MQGDSARETSPCCGRPSDTGNWKPRLEGGVWGFFPKIYTLAKLVVLLVLEQQSSSQSALSQQSLLAMEIYENEKTQTMVRGLFC